MKKVMIFDFYQVTSTQGLIRQIRRNIKEISKLIDKDLEKEFENLNKAIDNGNKKRTQKFFEKIFKHYTKIERKLTKSMKKQNKVLNKIQKRELETETAFKQILQILHEKTTQENKQIMTNCINNFKELRSLLYSTLRKVASFEEDLYIDYERLGKYISINASQKLLLHSMQFSRQENKLSRREKRYERNIKKILQKTLETATKIKTQPNEVKHQKKLRTKLKKIEEETQNLKNILREELHLIEQISHNLSVYRLRMYHKLGQDLHTQLKNIEQEGFNSELATQLNKKRFEIMKKIQTDSGKEYELTSHLENRKKRTEDQVFKKVA